MPVLAAQVATVIGATHLPDDPSPFGDDLVRTDNYLRLAEESAMGVHDLSKIEVVDVTA